MSDRLPSRYWADLTTAEFAALSAGRLVVVLPVAATEQHGPHLPVSVDADINRALVARVVKEAPSDLPFLIMPSLDIGLSPEHADFPGTLTLSAETMLAVLDEIGASASASGVRRLAFLNTHGGQSQILDLACQRLRARHHMLAAALNAYRYWDGAAVFGEHEAAYGIHGGAIETSIMMHVRPDLVRREELADFGNASQAMAGRFAHLRPYGRTVGLGWQMQDLNAAGAAGDATKATPEAGDRLLGQAAARTLEILAELASLAPEDFVTPPQSS